MNGQICKQLSMMLVIIVLLASSDAAHAACNNVKNWFDAPAGREGELIRLEQRCQWASRF